MEWLKFEKATLDKPEVFQIAGELGIDPDAVIGKLLRVWSWFDSQSVDGNANVTVTALLDRYAGITGFCKAMKNAGWMMENDGQICLPNYQRHTGKTAKARALGAARTSNSRASAACNAQTVTETLQDRYQIRKEKNRSEKIREDKIRKDRGTLDELAAFALELGMTSSDGESMFYHWEANGWKNGGSPVKDWKAGIRKWASQGWLPSQKAGLGKPARTAADFECDHSKGF